MFLIYQCSMDVEFRVIRLWLNALPVLLYGCWMAETKTVGKITLWWW